MSRRGRNRVRREAIEALLARSFRPFIFSQHNGGEISRVRSGMRIWKAGAGRDGDADISKQAIPGAVPRPLTREGAAHNPDMCAPCAGPA